jgi:hypothetical protein
MLTCAQLTPEVGDSGIRISWVHVECATYRLLSVFTSCVTRSIIRTAPLLSFAAALKFMARATRFNGGVGGRHPGMHVIAICVPGYDIYTIRGSLWNGEGLSRSCKSEQSCEVYEEHLDG